MNVRTTIPDIKLSGADFINRDHGITDARNCDPEHSFERPPAAQSGWGLPVNMILRSRIIGEHSARTHPIRTSFELAMG
jgi:hypothetical protein